MQEKVVAMLDAQALVKSVEQLSKPNGQQSQITIQFTYWKVLPDGKKEWLCERTRDVSLAQLQSIVESGKIYGETKERA